MLPLFRTRSPQRGLSGHVSATAGGQLTIMGTNFSTTGNIVQDPVASANASGPSNSMQMATGAAGDQCQRCHVFRPFRRRSEFESDMETVWQQRRWQNQPDCVYSSTSSTNQNGYATETHQSFSIGSYGTISVSDSNGQQERGTGRHCDGQQPAGIGRFGVKPIPYDQRLGRVDRGSGWNERAWRARGKFS